MAPRGRPKKYQGRRPNWTIRLQEQYGSEVKRLSESTGRSISEVCESLISRALSSGFGVDVENQVSTVAAVIVVTAPKQQDDELQITAICIEALKRVSDASARQRVLNYLAGRTEAN